MSNNILSKLGEISVNSHQRCSSVTKACRFLNSEGVGRKNKWPDPLWNLSHVTVINVLFWGRDEIASHSVHFSSLKGKTNGTIRNGRRVPVPYFSSWIRVENKHEKLFHLNKALLLLIGRNMSDLQEIKIIRFRLTRLVKIPVLWDEIAIFV